MKTLLLIVAICATAVASSPAASTSGFSRHVLPNGLTVIVRTNQSADLVSVQVITEAGQRMMEQGQAGIGKQ